jgi:hypothetical protein
MQESGNEHHRKGIPRRVCNLVHCAALDDRGHVMGREAIKRMIETLCILATIRPAHNDAPDWFDY